MSFIGVVLSGGQSQRMGMDKANLQAFGTSMLRRTQNVLLRAGAKHVVFSRNNGMANSIADIYPGNGPLSGIHAVCSHFLNENLLFVPVDLPLLSGFELQQLAIAGEESQCLVRFEGHNLPLFLKSSLPLLDALADRIVQKKLSVGAFCQQFPLLEIPALDEKSLFNSNTQTQWYFALRTLQANSNKSSTNPLKVYLQETSPILEGINQ